MTAANDGEVIVLFGGAEAASPNQRCLRVFDIAQSNWTQRMFPILPPIISLLILLP